MKPFTPKYTIEDMQELAALRGGRCMSKQYWNTETKLAWQCSKGHVWEATPSHVKRGQWCPGCTKANRQQLRLEKMQEIALGRGGKCLSKKYINCRNKLKWQCGKGHVWEAVADSIRRGHWCPYCAGSMKLTIGEMRKIAKRKGGKCLSEKYVNQITKLKWQCNQGHIWESAPQVVKRGQWCRICHFNSIRGTIEDMRQIALGRGGKCLSEKYIKSKGKLKWQCSKGHVWEADPDSVKSGRWCPLCAKQANILRLKNYNKSRRKTRTP